MQTDDLVVKAKLISDVDPEEGYLSAFLDEGQSEEIIKASQILLRTLEITLTELSEDRRYSKSVKVTITQRR